MSADSARDTGRTDDEMLQFELGADETTPPHVRQNLLPRDLRHDVHFIFVEVRLHPLFRAWLMKLGGAAQLEEVFGEVMALINALESYGRELTGDESHPVSSTHYDLHALRRNPPTETTPYADGPPVLRLLYGYVQHDDGHEIAVLAIGGDKTRLGNNWYPANITQAEVRVDQWCQQHPGYKPILKSGGPL